MRQTRDKTNTESAASSTSNQSSVMGNAGLWCLCLTSKNCPFLLRETKKKLPVLLVKMFNSRAPEK